MGKRKKVSTLTKIDPRILISNLPAALSQHESCSGTRVTTVVNPILPRTQPVSPEPPLFNADPSNFTEDYLDGADDDEGISESYFSTRVRYL